MAFFHFSQNNSGGVFDKKVGTDVIIEASSSEEANRLAEGVGIYFNGVADGRDCECCGDRWSELWGKESGDEVPSIYGLPITEKKSFSSFRKDVVVHYKDGRVERKVIEPETEEELLSRLKK